MSKIKKEVNETSLIFEERMKALKEHKKIILFEYEQLLRLHGIERQLLKINDSLRAICQILGNKI